MGSLLRCANGGVSPARGRRITGSAGKATTVVAAFAVLDRPSLLGSGLVLPTGDLEEVRMSGRYRCRTGRSPCGTMRYRARGSRTRCTSVHRMKGAAGRIAEAVWGPCLCRPRVRLRPEGALGHWRWLVDACHVLAAEQLQLEAEGMSRMSDLRAGCHWNLPRPLRCDDAGRANDPWRLQFAAPIRGH